MELNDSFIKAKEKLAKVTKQGPGGGDRLPAGQFLTEKFPVLEISQDRPPVDLGTWTLEVSGEVEEETTFDWEAFKKLPRSEQVSDFHCVTRWSKFDLSWGGVRWSDFIEVVKLLPTAKHVLLASGDGYTTNVPLEELAKEGVLLADTLDGQPLPQEHGGPLRLIVPHLYGWKSAKFLRKIRFAAEDQPGFWEVRGYHNHADPWKEERYS